MIEIRVYGTPAPQGSKRHVGKGIMIESSKKVKPWREAVKWAYLSHGDFFPLILQGPIGLEVTFTLARPKSAPKRRMYPDGRPDLSKLIRSTEDALTDIGAWSDDARVVECMARKVFPGTHPDALDAPGAVIKIWAHEYSAETRNAEAVA